MLNVTRPPANYRRALGAFKQAFRNKRNFSSFVHMVFALIIIQAEWTVSNLSDRHSRPDQKARRAYNRFFTTAAWDQTTLAQAMQTLKTGTSSSLPASSTVVSTFPSSLFSISVKTKLEPAVEKTVKPLQPPTGAAVTVVADSAYYYGKAAERSP